MDSPRRILSKGIAWSDLFFIKIVLTAVLRIDVGGKSKSEEVSWVKARDRGSLKQGDGSGSVEMWRESWHTLSLEPTRFADGLSVREGCEMEMEMTLVLTWAMRNAGLDEAQAGIKIAGRNINNLRYTDDTTLMAEREEELKSLLMKVKGESEKVGLNRNIQKTKIMASGPITSWKIDGETVEIVTDLNLGAPKLLQMVTVAMKLKDACSLEKMLWPTC